MGKKEEVLWHGNEMQQLIMDHIRDLVRVFDTRGHLVYASPSHEHVLGYTSAELTHTSVLNLIHPDDMDLAKSVLHDITENKVPRDCLLRYRAKNEQWVWLETHGNPLIKDGLVIGAVTVGRNATERLHIEQELKTYHEQLEFLAYHDPLTGLLNRTKFMDRVTDAVDDAEHNEHKMALLFLDCDNFKNINDMWGHHIGDEVIKELAHRIEQCVGTSETVGRFAGDEFTILLPEITNGEAAAQLAHELLQCAKHPWEIGGDEFILTVSIGAAVYPSDGTDASTLMKNADKALYGAKEAGKDNYMFYSQASEKHETRFGQYPRKLS